MKTWHVMGVIAAIMLAILAYALIGDMLSGKNPLPPIPEEPKVVVPIPDRNPNEGINPVRPNPVVTPLPLETPKPTVETPKP